MSSPPFVREPFLAGDPFEIMDRLTLVERKRSTPAGYAEHRSPFGRCLHADPGSDGFTRYLVALFSGGDV